MPLLGADDIADLTNGEQSLLSERLDWLDAVQLKDQSDAVLTGLVYLSNFCPGRMKVSTIAAGLWATTVDEPAQLNSTAFKLATGVGHNR